VRRVLGELDRKLLERHPVVVGVDEVGRGSLAGPVVVAAVGFTMVPEAPDVQDSKRLSPLQRERTASWVRGVASCWSIVELWVEVVDRLNIREATRVGMVAAVRSVLPAAGCVVSDAMELGLGAVPCVVQTRADADYFCVAASSILAKVHRDRLMCDLAQASPDWDWARNKGYGTLSHRRSLTANGRHFLHRRSFSWTAVVP
jgi:ribonuclease HII